VYTPAPGFIGRDRFRYSLCDVIDADGTGACGAASVTVTVVREESTTSSTEQSTTPAHLLVRPAEASILAGASQPYTAEAITQDGSSLGDVTAKTVFSISPSGARQGSRCTPATTGEHLITATLTQRGRAALNASAVLRVVPRKPSISRVTPRFTFPGMGVEVTGNTGSCTRVGVLTFHGITADVSVNVTADQQGNFVARFTVPKGTFPRIYKVELIVDCSGQLQRAEGELSVLNIAPTPVDDRASTLLDTPVTIEVTANDRNPDPDTGYPTLVLVSSQPTTARPRYSRTTGSATSHPKGSSARISPATASATTSLTRPGRPTAASPLSSLPSTLAPVCRRPVPAHRSTSIQSWARAGPSCGSRRRSTVG
jgi:hypothetical protein